MNTIWVTNLPRDARNDQLENLFKEFGEITGVRIEDQDDQLVGTVRFTSALGFEKALGANGKLSLADITLALHHRAPQRKSDEDDRDKSKGAGKSREPITPTASIWVGNLPGEIGSEEVEKEFKKLGAIKSLIVRASGSGKGNFAFVDYEEFKSAEEAVETMDNSKVFGDAIQVDFSRKAAKGDGKGKDGQDKHGTPSASVWIGNLPSKISSEDIEKEFKQHGTIKSVIVRPSWSREGNFAFVNYEEVRHAQEAVEKMDSSEVFGEAIQIRFSSNPNPPRSRERDRRDTSRGRRSDRGDRGSRDANAGRRGSDKAPQNSRRAAADAAMAAIDSMPVAAGKSDTRRKRTPPTDRARRADKDEPRDRENRGGDSDRGRDRRAGYRDEDRGGDRRGREPPARAQRKRTEPDSRDDSRPPAKATKGKRTQRNASGDSRDTDEDRSPRPRASKAAKAKSTQREDDRDN